MLYYAGHPQKQLSECEFVQQHADCDPSQESDMAVDSWYPFHAPMLTNHIPRKVTAILAILYYCFQPYLVLTLLPRRKNIHVRARSENIWIWNFDLEDVSISPPNGFSCKQITPECRYISVHRTLENSWLLSSSNAWLSENKHCNLGKE